MRLTNCRRRGCGRGRRASSLLRARRVRARVRRATMRPARRLSGSDCSHTRARPAQGGEEQPLAAEQRGLDAADHLNVVRHARLKRHDATRIHAQQLAGRERTLQDHGAARVDEAEPSPCSRCMMKPSPPKKPAPRRFCERDADAHALGRAQKRVLLRRSARRRAPRDARG